ncbi:2OG-Fe(II) oxygenase [Shewanella olleyana]|uniref:2OG-Fe(II) oxygenase n=1 Tax=Shewanella olleyana TaxID=135626 RepID=UPI00200D185D|nr:2OG-Fe(II) oxygenase [Shewanella olleyana]MCL1066215.1 2OG-Fe(II) oxygenase [Shewanella olleyana]
MKQSVAQLESVNQLLKKGCFADAEVKLKPLADLSIPEAQLLYVDILLRKQPSLGLDYLFSLTKKKVAGANYKAAFLLYFHPEVGVEFQTFLFEAVVEEDVSAIIVAANLYYQQGDAQKAYSILSCYAHLPPVQKWLSELSSPAEVISISNFSDLRRPDLSKLSYKLIAQEINLFTVDDFLTDFECRWLIDRAQTDIKRSKVVDGETGKTRISKVRTGSVAQFKPSIEDWILLNIEKKIAVYFNISIENGELSNVLKYLPGEEYKEHYDFFHPNDSGSELAMLDGGQRFKTVLIYLNDVEQGGETRFPRLEKSLSPKAKQLVVFNNTDNSLSPLPLSLHQGMPVTSGEKWLYSKWLRGQPTSYKGHLQSLNVI